MQKQIFPKEIFYNIDQQDAFAGRVIIDKIGDKFHAEIAIILKESHKIYQHVGNLHDFADFDEIAKVSLQMLAKYLRGN